MDTKTIDEFSQDQMAKALFALELFFERMPGTRMVLLGKTAKSIKEGYFLDAPLVVGVRKQELTKSNMTSLLQYLPDAKRIKNAYTGTFEGVPVTIKILSKDTYTVKGQEYSFIKNPDQVVYRGGPYFIPNSWDVYWSMQGLVK